jgi:hypothetical protein
MRWDDPVEKYLPEFKLAVQSKDRTTVPRFATSEPPHRHTRMGMLERNTGLSSDEILRRASSAEAIAPFRQRFSTTTCTPRGGIGRGRCGRHVMARAREARILDPLGMVATRTSVREAWNDPPRASYWWDETGRRVRSLRSRP